MNANLGGAPRSTEPLVTRRQVSIARGDVWLYEGVTGSIRRVIVAEMSVAARCLRLEGDRSWIMAEDFLPRVKGRLGRMVKRTWYLPRTFIPEQP